VIDAVLVLYRATAEESESWRTLRAALEDSLAVRERLRLLVYDNTPEESGGAAIPAGLDGLESAGGAMPLPVRYVRDAANGGLMAAYSRALKEAAGAEWLMLLDQDTTLTADYLREAVELAEELAEDVSVGAIVPKLRSGGKVRSPHRALGWAQAPLDEDFVGRAEEPVTAYNSGALLRVAALDGMGGFPAGFWLDYLDHATFAELRQAGLGVWVMETKLEHAMAWEDPEREMTVERYRGVLAAEERYHKRYGSWGSAMAFRLRMLKKAMAYAGWKDKRYARLSLKAAMGGGHREDWERE
jgi:GT2 family glycosyltransferase